ncbi:MAG: sensor histidine kinase [Chloroflexi bacterium]|nr:sensor histidine kinase [Chloroflexota bacterium]
MNDQSFARTTDRALNLAVYVTVLGVLMLSLLIAEPREGFERVALLTALFALFVIFQILLLRVPLPLNHSRRVTRLRLFFLTETSIASAIVWLVPDGFGFTPILFVILVAQTFFAFVTRDAIRWTMGLAIVLAILLFGATNWTSALLTLLTYAGTFLFFASVTTIMRREQTTRAQLETAHAQLRASAARVEQLAIAEERNRLAREIHDSLGHHLTILSVQLQAAARLIPMDSARAAEAIEKARAIASEALQDVRQSVSALRAQSAVDANPAQAIDQMIQEFRDATGILVNYRAAALDALAPAPALTIYRAVQEALTNVQKHAHASRVDVAIERDDATIRVQIADNGVGDSDARAIAGFGLLGLRERVEFLGGKLWLGARQGGGFELNVELPV